MITKIKVKVSFFVANILENDSMRFGFIKNGKPNKNGLLNKLIPTLVQIRKARRKDLKSILKNEYNRSDDENIINIANTVIDRVYFSGEELNILDEYIWIRPSKENTAIFDEIETSEAIITAQEVSVYIRGLLNEYSRLPQYKRELIAFNEESDIFAEACDSGQILYFYDKKTNIRHKVFAFGYYYGYLYDQTNYCIVYDINNKSIKSIPLSRIGNIYFIKQKYTPSSETLNQLQAYCDNYDFDKEITLEDF